MFRIMIIVTALLIVSAALPLTASDDDPVVVINEDGSQVTTTVRTENGKTITTVKTVRPDGSSKTVVTTAGAQSAGGAVSTAKAGADDDYTPFITGYAGIGRYYWKNFNLSGDAPIDQESTPYTMKKAYVRADLFIFNMGLEYLTSQLFNTEEVTREDDIDEENDRLAKQMRYFAGLGFGSYEIKANISFKKFAGVMRSNGVNLTGWSYSGQNIPVIYYPGDGTYLELDKGAEVGTFTVVRDYELVLSRRFSRYVSYDLGLRYMNYKSPQFFKFGEDQYSSISSDINAVIMNEFQVYTLSSGVDARTRNRWGLMFGTYFPACFGVYGYKNDYFDIKPAFTSYLVTGRGKIYTGLEYDHLRLEVGFDYTYLYSAPISRSAKLKQDLFYYSSEDGSPGTVARGTKMSISSDRIEVFYGVYFHAMLMF